MNLTVIIATSISLLFNGFAVDQQQKTTEQPAENASISIPCTEGDDEDPIPILAGSVKDNTVFANPLYHACVELKTTSYVLVSTIGTDINGHYYFNSIASGSYYLVVSASGFTTQTIPVTITSSPQTLNVTMY